MGIIIWIFVFFQPHTSFVQNYHDYAQEEMRIYGIPASVTLAQGILESQGGCSWAATHLDNFFGIRCHNRVHGSECMVDLGCAPYNDSGEECRLRIYASPWWSFRDHSKYITTGKYSSMRSTCGKNPVKWCDELQKRGYAADSGYAKKLKDIIRVYNLTRFDKQ